MAVQQLTISAIGEAERNQRRSIDLCREIKDEFQEAIGRQQLGLTLSYRGAWQEVEQELDTALTLFEKLHIIQSEGVVWSYRALRFLLLSRTTSQSQIQNLKSSMESSSHAIELADEQAKDYPVVFGRGSIERLHPGTFQI